MITQPRTTLSTSPFALLRGRLPLVAVTLVALNLLVALGSQRVQPTGHGDYSPEWVSQRVAKWSLQESECFTPGAAWMTDSRAAQRLAFEQKKLLFVMATNGDVLTGRL